MGGAGIRGPVREVVVEGLEEGASGVRGGGDDHVGGAHLEVHDGAVLFGEFGKGHVRHGAHEREGTEDGPTRGPGRELSAMGSGEERTEEEMGNEEDDKSDSQVLEEEEGEEGHMWLIGGCMGEACYVVNMERGAVCLFIIRGKITFTCLPDGNGEKTLSHTYQIQR